MSDGLQARLAPGESGSTEQDLVRVGELGGVKGEGSTPQGLGMADERGGWQGAGCRVGGSGSRGWGLDSGFRVQGTISRKMQARAQTSLARGVPLMPSPSSGEW